MKCSFCGEEIEIGTGKIVVQSDGKPLYYCSSKCENNSKIRNPRKVKWTNMYRKEKAAGIKK